MLYPSEEFLYAPVQWTDHSEGYTDIRYHKSKDGIAKLRSIALKCVMRFALTL